MVVSTLQPHGVMAKVLFEPNSKLADSATYDITAWSLPYVYGLQTYGVKEKVVADKIIVIPASQAKLNSDGYGLLVRYNSFEDSKILAALLSAGVKIRFASRDFTANGARYKRGTLVILKKGNEEKMNLLNGLLSRTHADVSAINTGYMDNGYDFGSDKVRLIKAPKVALVTGDGVYAESAGEVWNLFDEQLNYPITLINNDELSSASLKNVDVLILSAGQHKILADKEGNAALKAWVKEGGKIIALDQAAAEMAAGDWNLKLKKEEEDSKSESTTFYADLKKFAENEHDGIKSFIAGAIYRVDIDTTHPLCFGMGNQYYTLKQDDHVYEYLKSGWNAGVLKKDNYVAGFVGSKIKPKIKDSFVFGEQQIGDGSVVYLTDNPIFRNFWESGKLLLANAVFLSGQ
jgi:hypothetical protein